MQETDSKGLTVAAIAFDIQQKTIRRLELALIIALAVCGVSVITALYALSGRCCHEQKAAVVGVSAVAGAHIGRQAKTRFDVQRPTGAATV